MGKHGVQAALNYARRNQARNLDGFKELLRFPSVSLEAGSQNSLLDCANWILREMRRIGLRNCQLLPTAGIPIVYADWLAARDDAPTILFYAHYDVQPAGDASLWESPPFEPTVSDGALVARGAVDDKCGVWVNLKAIEAALSAAGELPMNIKLLFEGEEEFGSVNTAAVLSDYRSILAADAVIISDGPFSSQQPSIGYALRGSISGEVTVTGPAHDLHSGRYGGAVKNPIHFLARIISSFHDASGRVGIKGFYDDIIPMSDRQIRHLNLFWKTSGPDVQRAARVDAFFGDYLGVFAERTTSLPTLDVGGISGGHQDEGARAIIPAVASCKLTIRHVPGQDADAMWRRFVEHVMAFEEPGIAIATELLGIAHPSLMSDDGREIRAIQRAVKTVLDKEALLMRHGGSLAIGGLLAKELNAPVTMFGYGSGGASHAPNEFIDLDDLQAATEVAIQLLFELAEK
jgi:acetylornithine deacetylase/succinyl-diaminopimelate desuccinylase-like protein